MNSLSDSKSSVGLVYDDEINLTDLFHSIWMQRGLVVGITLLVFLSVCIFHVTKQTFSSPERVDYPVSLLFLQSDGKYPNGMPFSPRDMVSARVVNDVSKKYNLDVSKISGALVSEYSNSLLSQAEKKLSDYLSDTKSPVDIKESAQKALLQMRDQTRSVVTLRINLDEAGIAAEVGHNVLREIVEVWSQQAIKSGLMNQDVSYPAQKFEILSLNNLVDTYEDLTSYAADLQKAVTQLQKQPGTQGLVVEGQTLSDLNRLLVSLVGSDVEPLRSFAYSNSAVLIANNPEMQVRVSARKRLLELEGQRLSKMILSYDETLKQLSKQNQTSVGNQTGATSNQMATAQFDQSLLNSLLDLGNRLSSVQMREDVYRLKNRAIEARLELEKELEILTVKDTEDYSELNVIEMLGSSLKKSVSDLNSVQAQLVEFIHAYRDQALSSGASLYMADAAPQVRGGYLQLSNKFGLTLSLGLVLGLMLGVFMALIRAAFINRQSTEKIAV